MQHHLTTVKYGFEYNYDLPKHKRSMHMLPLLEVSTVRASSWYNCANPSPTMYMYVVSIVHIHQVSHGITVWTNHILNRRCFQQKHPSRHRLTWPLPAGVTPHGSNDSNAPGRSMEGRRVTSGWFNDSGVSWNGHVHHDGMRFPLLCPLKIDGTLEWSMKAKNFRK